MPRVDPVNFYLEEREEGSNTYHYQYIDWRRILSMFHPKKANNEILVAKYYEVCERSLLHALTQKKNTLDFPEIKQNLVKIRTYKPTT